ncbi:TBC1 domain family member 3L isoform X5 [Oryctolagus cuniculus]|uniref:TBC1 domain family member 3L isoform X5 n=1 Tax=Oryctolagus cuniculus TaxID=9986 RepID=UPI00387A27CB
MWAMLLSVDTRKAQNHGKFEDLGYSQGLSHVAALLLMWLSEEDAFWALVQLMEDSQHAMHDFYTPDCPKLERFQHHLGDIMHRVLPSLEKHLVPFPLALRMWDIYILEGEHVLTMMAYTVLKIHQTKPMEDCSPALQVPPGSQERAPPPVSLKCKTIVEESKGYHPTAAAPQEPVGASASVPEETGPLRSTIQPDSKQDAKEEKGSRGESSTQPCGQGSSKGASGSGNAAHLSGPQCSWLAEPGPLWRWTSLIKLNVTFKDDNPDSDDEEYSSCLEEQKEDEEEEEDRAAECPWSPWPKLLRDQGFVQPEMILEEDEEGGHEEGASPEPSSPALSVKSSESLHGPGLLAPQSLQSRGDLSRWGGLPNLSPPVKGADFWPLELGGQQGLRAPPQLASEPLDPGSMQAVPALGAGLNTPSLHGSPMHSGDSHGLEPAGASPALGDQACVPSLAGGLIAAHSMEQLDVCWCLEGKKSPAGVQLRRARSLASLYMAASMMEEAPL